MSRFRSLEFTDGEEDQWQSRDSVRKDEAYYLGEAQRAFERADFESGLRLYARALEENSGSLEAWTGQVRMLIELGEYREAKAWADKALEQNANHPELLAAKGVALGRIGELDDALAFSDAAVEERGSTSYVWLARADVLLARGERRAEFCLDRALAASPRNWFVAWLAARIRMFYDQMACGLRLLQEAIAWDAGRFVVWLQMGQCEAALGYRESATRSFRQAIDLNPDCQAAHTGMIQLRSQGWLGRFAGLWRQMRGR